MPLRPGRKSPETADRTYHHRKCRTCAVRSTSGAQRTETEAPARSTSYSAATIEEKEISIMYKVRWVRSHPEIRHTWPSEWNEDAVMNSMADSLATLAMQEYVGNKGNTELTPARDSNRVWYAYTQAKGGKKMRLTGKLRQMLKDHISSIDITAHIWKHLRRHTSEGKTCIK